MSLLAILAIASISAGCAINRGKSLLVTSETVIGLKIGTNVTTQIPEVKFGYIRTEGAVVPTKGSETASVVARLNFQSFLRTQQGQISSVILTGKAAESEAAKDISKQ